MYILHRHISVILHKCLSPLTLSELSPCSLLSIPISWDYLFQIYVCARETREEKGWHFRKQTERQLIQVSKRKMKNHLSILAGQVKKGIRCTVPQYAQGNSKGIQTTVGLKFPSFLLECNIDKGTFNTWSTYLWEICRESSYGHMQTHRHSSFIFSTSFQGSTPRLPMHLPVSSGWK